MSKTSSGGQAILVLAVTCTRAILNGLRRTIAAAGPGPFRSFALVETAALALARFGADAERA
jgi:hypothetical protein